VYHVATARGRTGEEDEAAVELLSERLSPTLIPWLQSPGPPPEKACLLCASAERRSPGGRLPPLQRGPPGACPSG